MQLPKEINMRMEAIASWGLTPFEPIPLHEGLTILLLVIYKPLIVDRLLISIYQVDVYFSTFFAIFLAPSNWRITEYNVITLR